MSKEKFIKDKNRKWLICYILFQIILFALFAAIISPTFKDINELLSKLKSPSGFFPLLFFPFAIIFEGFIHSDYKAMLIFWRFKNVLPGHRAFSDIARKDPRIDIEKLKSLFPNGLPENPQEQNSNWYKLYRKFSEKPIVYDSHKSFLLTRDLTAITIILMPFCFVAHVFWNTPGSSILYHLLLLFVITLMINLSSQNHGKRFVANVLVEATL